MFSKGKSPQPDKTESQAKSQPSDAAQTSPVPAGSAPTPAQLSQGSKPKPSPSLLSSDITVKGNISTGGDIQIEGEIEGDVRAHLLTVGESATIRGEVIADDVVVNGRVIGKLRGLKVRLTASARVEGDIIHKSIAIESGAHFEGSVQRREDPLGDEQAGEPIPLAPARGGKTRQQSGGKAAAADSADAGSDNASGGS